MDVDVLDINYHNVTVYFRKLNSLKVFLGREMCTKHLVQIIEMCCKPCNIPVCSLCRKFNSNANPNPEGITKYKCSIWKQTNPIQQYFKSTLAVKLSTTHRLFCLNLDLTLLHAIGKWTKLKLQCQLCRRDSMDNVQSEITLKYKAVLLCRFFRQKMKMKGNIAKSKK